MAFSFLVVALADYQAEHDFLVEKGESVPAELTDRLNMVRKLVAARAPPPAPAAPAAPSPPTTAQPSTTGPTSDQTTAPSTNDDGGPVAKRARTGDLVTLTLEPDPSAPAPLPRLAKSVIRIDPSVTVRRLRRFIVQRLPKGGVDASDIRLTYEGTNLGPEWNLEYIRKTLARDAPVPSFLYSVAGS